MPLREWAIDAHQDCMRRSVAVDSGTVRSS
jgi:hypothetical protein